MSYWVPGFPRDDIGDANIITPHAVTLHRTYGGYPGDFSVIRNNRLCQLLVGKNDGEYCQFMSLDRFAAHANGANRYAIGLEFTGVNEEPLTDWQVARLRDVVDYVSEAFNIPRTYLDPDSVPRASVHVNDGTFKGYISHRSVATDDGSSQHTDMITVADWYRVDAQPAPQPVEEDDDMLAIIVEDGPKAGLWIQNGDILVFPHNSAGSISVNKLTAGRTLSLSGEEFVNYKGDLEAQRAGIGH